MSASQQEADALGERAVRSGKGEEAAARVDIRRLVLIAATTAGATFTILVAGGAGPQSLPVRIVYDLMAAAVLIPWLLVSVVRPAWRPASRLAPALLVVIAAFVVSTITSTIPRLSLEMLGYVVLLVGVYLFLVALMRRPVIRAHLERLALVLCLVVATLYLIQVFQIWSLWWQLVGRFAIPPMRPAYVGITLGSPNPVATLVLILGAFALATAQFRGRPGRVTTVVLIVVVAVATFITTSRGAWLGLIAGVVVVGAIALVRGSRDPRLRAVARSRAGLALAAVACGVLLLVGSAAVMSGRVSLDDRGYRAGFAHASVEMIAGSPITGVGPGTWGVLRAEHMDPADLDLLIPHAHNIYLQTVAEFGVVGLIAGVVLAAALVMLIASAIRSDDRRRRAVGFAALFAVVLFAVQQVADVLVNVPALMLAVALPIAWLDGVALGEPLARPASPAGDGARGRVVDRLVPVVCLAVVAVTLLGLVRIERAAASSESAVAEANALDWTAARAGFADAAADDPAINLYAFGLGLSAANTGDVEAAEAAFEAASAGDDYPYAWLNLAAVRWRLGDAEGARAALDRAERLGLQRVPIALAAGWLRQRLGEPDAAVANYARAVALAPTLIGDPFWGSADGPPGGVDRIRSAAGELVYSRDRLLMDLSLGRFDDATANVATLEPNGGFLTDVVAAWQGDPAAWSAMRAAAASDPTDGNLQRWCRLLAAQRGDEATANRYALMLSILATTDQGGPAFAAIETGDAVRMPAAVLDRYGSIYRRSAPEAQVVSILPQIVWTNDGAATP